MEQKSYWLPKLLLVVYGILFVWLGIAPYARDVWFAENMTILPIVLVLVILFWKGIRFSNLSYILMAFLIFMHTIGGHFTFERVPFGFVDDLVGSGRNNYDRFGHFTVGFYAYPILELLNRYKVISKKWISYSYALFVVISIAAIYELFEWWYAVHSDPAAGIAVLGSQGDIWDAQKDMLSDSLGGIFALLLYFIKDRIASAKRLM